METCFLSVLSNFDFHEEFLPSPIKLHFLNQSDIQSQICWNVMDIIDLTRDIVLHDSIIITAVDPGPKCMGICQWNATVIIPERI